VLIIERRAQPVQGAPTHAGTPVATIAGVNIPRVVRAGVLAVLVAVTVAVPSGPASTLSDLSCDKGEVCVWDERNHKGCYADMPVPSFDSDWIDDDGPFWANCAGHINDRVSSYWNRGDKIVVFYTKPGGLGNSLCVFPGAKGKRIGWDRMDNQFSSHNNELPDAEGGGESASPRYPGEAVGPDDCTDKDTNPG
jgi:hypothetical protein